MGVRKTWVISLTVAIVLGIGTAFFLLSDFREDKEMGQEQSISGKEIKRILVLNSYHTGYVWEDSVVDGIRSVLDKSDLNLNISYEFMDTKRHNLEHLYDALRWLYRLKYQNTDFNVIITSDNNALNFLLSYGEELFPGVPVVFCGINGYQEEMLGGRKGVTGIAEDYDLKGTLDIALSMHPETKNVAVVSGVSTSSIINQAQLRNLMPAYEDRVDFIDLSVKNINELTQALRELPEKTVILYISYYLTPGGKTLTVPESTSLVFKNSNLPIYSPWEYTLGNGVLGGMMLSGWDQGRIASETALRILGGVPADKIPVLRNSTIQPVFDYKILKHFGIPLSKVPKKAVIRNEPQTIYYKYKTFLWAVMGFILYQTVTIFLLIRIIARRKRAEASLRLEESRLEALLELKPHGRCSHRQDIAFGTGKGRSPDR